MELMTSWEKKGRQEGMERVVLTLLEKRFGEAGTAFKPQVEQLTPEQIDALAVALLEMQSIEQVEDWFRQQQEG